MAVASSSSHTPNEGNVNPCGIDANGRSGRMSRAELPAHCRLHLSTCPQLLHTTRWLSRYTMDVHAGTMYSTVPHVQYCTSVHPPDCTWDVAPCTAQGPTCANMPAEWEQRYYRYYRKYRTEVLLGTYRTYSMVLSFRVVDGLVRSVNSASSFRRVNRSVLVYACTDVYCTVPLRVRNRGRCDQHHSSEYEGIGAIST
jgi:hypothetical protein